MQALLLSVNTVDCCENDSDEHDKVPVLMEHAQVGKER